MKYLLCVILLFAISCTDNKEWSVEKIERLDKQNKLSDAISKIESMEELNTLMSLLTDDQKEYYLDETAQKEQDLRFPRPIPMTLEYLDSITNESVMWEAKNYLEEVDKTIYDITINNRLEFIESYNIYITNSMHKVHIFSDYFTNIQSDSQCQNMISNIFYNTVYFDTLTKKFIGGKTIYTNNIDYILPDTNNIVLGTPESILYITNLSPSERLYLDLNSDILFIRKLYRLDLGSINQYYYTNDHAGFSIYYTINGTNTNPVNGYGSRNYMNEMEFYTEADSIVDHSPCSLSVYCFIDSYNYMLEHGYSCE